MPKITKPILEADLRVKTFGKLQLNEFERVNDRTYGIIIIDMNGTERYIRLNAVVTEEREGLTARQLMAQEQREYQESMAKKAEQKAKAAEKAAADKERRAKEKKEKGE